MVRIKLAADSANIDLECFDAIHVGTGNGSDERQ
jgi:hypothetical protein